LVGRDDALEHRVLHALAIIEARANLAGALRDMAETNLLRGEALPVPDPARSDPEAELEEPIYLVLQTGQNVTQQVTAATPWNAEI